MSEKFNLKWNDFQSNITSAFSQLRTKTRFQDVTLVSDDQQQISAHRVVLTACSGYFNNILSQNDHSHPLLCLDGINFLDLNNVLDFIYNGEVQIFHEDIDRFLQIGKKLEIQGLLNSFEDEKKETIEEPTTYAAKIVEENTFYCTDSREQIMTLNSGRFQNLVDLDAYIEQQIIRYFEGYKCIICNKTSSSRGHIKEHIEIHIAGLSFKCNSCEKITSTRKNLRMHKTRSCKKKLEIKLEPTTGVKSS